MVLKLGLNPDYVLDKMEMYEVQALLQNMHLKVKENWEQTRMLSYIVAQTQSTKKLKIQDIITFPWEEQEKLENQQVTNSDKQRLIKMAKILEKNGK